MEYDFSIGAAASAAVEYTLDNFSPMLDVIADVIGYFAGGIKNGLSWLPPWAFISIIALFALWRIGWKFAVLCGAALLLIVGMGLWKETIETLSLVVAATAIAIMIGIPLGILMARSSITGAGIRPLLDLMQTMPAFVYLIPAAMFFGLGAVPGIIATVIFSMPPVVRLTALGLSQVNREFVEAGLAFGCTDRQLLLKVQFPLALPSIMAGVNQTIMLGLSMVVIASMIGAGGLGNTVLTGIQRLDVGLGFEGGLAVVILAVILDRLTQSLSRPASLKIAVFAPGRIRARQDAAQLETAPIKTGA
ncbi:proline/glycine betaine ABC transporter permease [Microvirga sp. 17 mud 1-3]|uniref:ABC transporter permease n=1 Tax=Microvirga sp. 17 mud 1-3 TaxID=2082949 RepID=UPI000D6A8415|nr:proline/glycine betaine ABC transporter permease [Microvirga sp. 17 mud 1-3]AWM85458.1 glycine/betaine ABC transporter [Microvirga sp. 17 mud 1-3]